jgi:polyisoprenoid-binding protein YceI
MASLNHPGDEMKTGMRRAALALALGSGVLFAAEVNIGPATKSTVVATFRQEGVSVDSPFTRFSGKVSYDAKNVAAATALVEVETASLDMGDPGYSAEVAKKSWFDSATHPKAVFRSTAIKPVAANRFDATGTLTVKGKMQTITVPVTVSATPAGNTFDGTFTMSRKAFGIGDPVWDGVLEDKVTVRFHLVGGR